MESIPIKYKIWTYVFALFMGILAGFSEKSIVTFALMTFTVVNFCILSWYANSDNK